MPGSTSPLSAGPLTVSPVQAYAARKRYVCPGCDGPVEIGTFHLVVVPDHAPEARRHWHRGCWFRERRSDERSRSTLS